MFKKFVFTLMLLMIPALAIAGPTFVVYAGPGTNSDNTEEVNGNNVMAQGGIMWQMSEGVGLGLETINASKDVNIVQLVSVFSLEAATGATWKPYLKMALGGAEIDNLNRDVSFVWHVEPSFGLFYDHGRWGGFMSTGPSLILGQDTDPIAGIQSKMGVFVRIGNTGGDATE